MYQFLHKRYNVINDIDNIKHALSFLEIQTEEIMPFEYGTLQSTYKVKSKAGFFVVKLFNKDRKRFIKQEIVRLRRIGQYSNLTIFPLNNEPLLIGDKVAYYYKFFDGDRISSLEINNIHYKFGQLAGRFDLILQKLAYNKKKFSFNNFLNSDTIIKDKNLVNGRDSEVADWIKRGRDLLKQELNNKDSFQIRIQFIHKDLHFDNVLYNKQIDKYFIIDTTGLSAQFLPKEIAVIIGKEFVGRDGTINYKIINDLLRGYNEFIKFNKIELESIPLFIIEKKIGELLFLDKQYESNSITKKMFDKYTTLSLRGLQVAVVHYIELIKFFKYNSHYD